MRAEKSDVERAAGGVAAPAQTAAMADSRPASRLPARGEPLWFCGATNKLRRHPEDSGRNDRNPLMDRSRSRSHLVPGRARLATCSASPPVWTSPTPLAHTSRELLSPPSPSPEKDVCCRTSTRAPALRDEGPAINLDGPHLPKVSGFCCFLPAAFRIFSSQRSERQPGEQGRRSPLDLCIPFVYNRHGRSRSRSHLASGPSGSSRPSAFPFSASCSVLQSRTPECSGSFARSYRNRLPQR
jgi:hypothetical protein